MFHNSHQKDDRRMEFQHEKIELKDEKEGIKVLQLPQLTEEEKNLIDPLVPPTSGLRIQLYDIIEKNEKYFMTRRKLFLFLRVFRAISQKFKEMKGGENLNVLIVTDNRPSKDLVLGYCSQIFAYEGFTVYHQADVPGESKVSSPYGAAATALYEDINLVMVLTASHNELAWNGIKFYIDYPIPMSGDLFKEISQRALNFEEIYLKTDFKSIQIDAVKKNNEYVINLLSRILEIKSIKGKNIILWPYLGKAKGIVDLFEHYGANVILVEEEINPPNPIKEIRTERLQELMIENDSTIALLLDADRDRIALYVKQNGEYFTYIPNEIYSAMHNILARDFNNQIINVRTVPSDPRGDKTSTLNILTGVGYKHLGVIIYFLLDVEVDQSKIDTAILYMEDENGDLIQVDNAKPLKQQIIQIMEEQGKASQEFVTVMWEESGGHTINIVKVSKKEDLYEFTTDFPIIADKYPVPALVLITELICRGYTISEEIDWSIVGINRTIHAEDEQKIKIMEGFQENDGKSITINDWKYNVQALSDNNGKIDIYQLKRDEATIYFRPSGTGPDVRFYIFGKRDTYDEEIKKVQQYVKQNYA